MSMHRNPSFYCQACRMQVQLVHHGEHKYQQQDGASKDYVFGHCARCNRVGLVEYEHEADGGAAEPRQLWPSVLRPIDFELPPRVMEAYQETLRCEAAGAWMATAVMARRTLEVVVREFAPDHERFLDGLRALYTKGLISEELCRWGEELRFLGDVGVLPTDPKASHQDAKEALEFLGALLETLYHLREKFRRMQARRQRGRLGADAPERPS
ncbi:DUF4145 domain-containing protein [Polyangium mundeleinium]|uniref:DUF4145 domain-containing protein n=1 Tax=Polyangium mundeleinium TaxID=2995306 RepID=A0ABT5EY79_9BACT|nr:DUF4145 domain-containing protein [Polyangium mundeleinium]MDC0746349.1 DUF4145 domain-containing protein [Polyangium mundeleinium]